MSVSVYFHHNVSAIVKSRAEARNRSAADALILLMSKEFQSGVLAVLLNKTATSIRARVIHAIDVMGFGSDSA